MRARNKQFRKIFHQHSTQLKVTGIRLPAVGFLPAQMIQKCGEDYHLLQFHKVFLTPGTTVEESFTPYPGIQCPSEKEATGIWHY